MNEQQALAQMVRPGAVKPVWCGGVIQIWITRACDKSCFGCTQGSNLGGKPGMMTPEQFEIACKNLEDYHGVVGVFGGNPSCRAGTKVFTTDGIFPIEELENKTFNVRNLHGNISPAFCRLSGKGKRLYRIKLRGGHEYFATAEHEWPALSFSHGENSKRKDRPNYNPRKIAESLGKIKTEDLKPGMRLPVIQADSLPFGKSGSREDGFLAGWITGDGWINERGPRILHPVRRNGMQDARNSKKPNKVRCVGMIVGNTDSLNIIESLTIRLRQMGTDAQWRLDNGCQEITVASTAMDDWLDEFGVSNKSLGAPSTIWSTASEEFRRGYIDGLFSADGSVEISTERKFARIRLPTAHKQLAKDVSDLLGFYGIKTSIIKRERKGNFPNGKDYKKTYTSYVVSIQNTASVEHFAKIFRLSHDEKRTRLESVIGFHSPDNESDNIEILAVEKTDLHEDVWDISVGDDTHCFQLAHCITGNCISPHFEAICEIMTKYIPFHRRGVWSNNPLGKGPLMRKTFNPAVSNLNVHLDRMAYDEFKKDWPESNVMGLKEDSRHSPPFVAMQDMTDMTEDERWERISRCDINRNWSAMYGVFRNEVRFWFCEIAGAQAMLHQHERDYPDTGLPITPRVWDRPMEGYADQVRFHCHGCGIPLRGYGSLATVPEGTEYVSKTHESIYKPKVRDRLVQLVTNKTEAQADGLRLATDYIGNSHR